MIHTQLSDRHKPDSCPDLSRSADDGEEERLAKLRCKLIRCRLPYMDHFDGKLVRQSGL